MFGPDIVPSLSMAVELINTSASRNGEEGLHDSDQMLRMGRKNAVSYIPDGTKNEVIAMRNLRTRLDEVVQAPTLEARFAHINDLFFNASAIPQILVHDGFNEADRIPHFHYTLEDAPYISHIMALTAYALARLTIMGEWSRLRTCEGDNCNKLFMDFTRNGARRYCDSQTCGNRLHAAHYRARKNAALELDHSEPVESANISA